MNKSDIKELKEQLLNLINNAGIKKADEFSFGLLYKLKFENNINILTVGVRQRSDNLKIEFSENNEKFDKDTPVHKIYFNTDYELMKYLLWTGYNIEISDIFGMPKKSMETVSLSLYRDKNLNDTLREIIIAMRNNSEMEKEAIMLTGEKTEESDEIEEILEKYHIQKAKDLVLDKIIYSNKSHGNNCGYAWDNILNFKIIGFEINYMEESEKPAYSLDVKFQIESYLEEIDMYNYYDVKIPKFLVFPSVINDDNDRQILKNNLSLIYSMTEDTMYSMILREFPNFREYPVTISRETEEINLENFSEEVLSGLAEHMAGIFYTGSGNIYMEDDITELCNEFMKRSFFDFRKHLFSEFVLGSTGIRVNDFNTVNSFYMMIEKIASQFEKEKDDERV